MVAGGEPNFQKNVDRIESLIQRLRLPAKLVRIFARLLLLLGIVGLLVGVSSYFVFRWEAGWGFWNWVIPTVLCGLPSLLVCVCWYALSTIAEIPETLLSLKGRVKEGFFMNIQRVVKKQNEGERKTLVSSMRLLWHAFMAMGEVEDVVFAGTVVAFIISPLGWIMTLALLAWLALGSAALLVGAACLFFF